MNNKEFARAMRERLTPDTWWNGRPGSDVPGKECLGVAAARIITINKPEYVPDYRKHETRFLRVANQLFPERRCGSFPDFNDNPDTTYEDILLVLKHLEEEDES